MPNVKKKNAIALLIAKDLRLFFFRGGGLGQALLLGLLLIFVFSLSKEIAENFTPKAIATIFWLASTFCMVLIVNNLYAIEESNNARVGLSLLPASIHTIWLAKSFCAFLFMLLAQIVFFLALVIFCNATIYGSFYNFLLFLLLVDVGMIVCGSLLGALSSGGLGKESLLSILLFPLLTPLLFAGIEAFSILFTAVELSGIVNQVQGEFGELQSWFALILSFDGIFTAMALVLFPFVYSHD